MDSWLLLNAAGTLHKTKLKNLLDRYQKPEEVLRCSDEELLRSGLVDRGFVQALSWSKKKFDLNREYRLIKKYKVKVVTINDETYPASLRYINDAPIVLYVVGEIKKDDLLAIGVVGTRQYTQYGKNVTRKLSGELAAAKVTIVSGLARGIDTFAHESALAAKGRTIAVLGSGLACLYPPENQKLALSIAGNGAVISEFHMQEQPSKTSFPLRNRLISGLSLGVLVVEADIRSGALITANWATEQGREVFAVPGNITNEYSRGTNKLIKDGAKLVEDYQDIIDEISCLKELIGRRKKVAKGEALELGLDTQEQELLQLIGLEPVNIEILGRQSGKSISQLSTLLLQLVMKELVKETSGKNYVRTIS